MISLVENTTCKVHNILWLYNEQNVQRKAQLVLRWRWMVAVLLSCNPLPTPSLSLSESLHGRK